MSDESKLLDKVKKFFNMSSQATIDDVEQKLEVPLNELVANEFKKSDNQVFILEKLESELQSKLQAAFDTKLTESANAIKDTVTALETRVKGVEDVVLDEQPQKPVKKQGEEKFDLEEAIKMELSITNTAKY